MLQQIDIRRLKNSRMHTTEVTSPFLVADCGPLTPPANGGVDTPSGTTSGSIALYSCDEGWILTGSSSSVCGCDGLWLTPAPPTCEGVLCIASSIPVMNAHILCLINKTLDLYNIT